MSNKNHIFKSAAAGRLWYFFNFAFFRILFLNLFCIQWFAVCGWWWVWWNFSLLFLGFYNRFELVMSCIKLIFLIKIQFDYSLNRSCIFESLSDVGWLTDGLAIFLKWKLNVGIGYFAHFKKILCNVANFSFSLNFQYDFLNFFRGVTHFPHFHNSYLIHSFN